MPFTTDEVATDVRQPIRPRDVRVLIADDRSGVVEALRHLLRAEPLHIETASSAPGILAAVEERNFDIALIDLNCTRETTSRDGVDLFSRIRAIDPELPVVVMTPRGRVDLAVEAMRRGARDFIQKPWEDARLLASVRTQIALSQALRKGRQLEAENSRLRRLQDMSLEDVECFLIKNAMTRSDGNVSQSAKALGLSRSALYRRLQRYHLLPSAF